MAADLTEPSVAVWIAGSSAQSGRRRGQSVASSVQDSSDAQHIKDMCEFHCVSMLESEGTDIMPSCDQCFGHIIALALLTYRGPWVNALSQMGPERRAMSFFLWRGS